VRSERCEIVSKLAVKRFPFAKIVIVMAVVFLIGLGLCGLDMALGAYGIGSKTGEEFYVGPLDGISMIVMGLSLLGLAVSLLLWALSAIIWGIASSGKDKETQKLFDEDDKPNRDGKA